MRRFSRILRCLSPRRHSKDIALRILLSALLVLAVCHTQAQYVVSSIADSGPGTLRQAILDANASPSPGANITFSVAGTINLASRLPAITKDGTVINGYSAPGASQGPIGSRTLSVTVSGGNSASITQAILINASNVTICGLVINGIGAAQLHGILLVAGNATPARNDIWIWGNYIGTDPSGTVNATSGRGIGMFGTVSGSTSNVRNPVVGTNGDGVNDANEGNLMVSGVNSITTSVILQNIDGAKIAGNYIGVNAAGSASLQGPNATSCFGITIENCSQTTIGTDGSNPQLQRNVIGGVSDGVDIKANVSGGFVGSYLNNASPTRNPGNNVVFGNYIGVDKTGMSTIPTLHGVNLTAACGNSVGSLANPSYFNLIYGKADGVNCQNGTTVASGHPEQQFATANNDIANNFIGVAADGVTTLSGAAGAFGVFLNGATTQRITQNIISGFDTGINVTSTSSFPTTNNTISRNSIYGNGRLAIDLTNDFVTPNDGILGPVTAGTPNQLVDYPIISSAILSGSSLTLQGFVGNASGSPAFAGMNLEFFIADNNPANQDGPISNANATVAPHGEGRTYIGSGTTDGSGNFNLSFDIAGLGVTGTFMVTGTTTTGTGSTSEFGPNMSVQAPTFAITGNVFNDIDGLADNAVDGPGTNAGGLNAILIDNLTGQVVAVPPVAADGSYSISNIPAGNYSVMISTANPAIGTTAPVSATLPAGWESTAEGTTLAGDGAPNSVINLGAVSADVTNANFGIEQAPETAVNAQPAQINPVGTGTLTVPPVAFSVSNVGTNPNTGDPAPGAVTGIIITAFPSNTTSITIDGTLYMDLASITAAYPLGIPTGADGTPTVAVLIDPVNMPGNFDIVLHIQAIDAAGVKDPTPGSITLPILENPMPVTLTDFSVTKGEGRTAKLDWATTEETNSDRFEVERSQNGKIWKMIASLAAGGEGKVLVSYSFVDPDPSAGDNFYRLKMIDQDGTFAYSKINVLRLAENDIYVYPNPSSGLIKVSGEADRVGVYNLNGKLVYTQKVRSGLVDLTAVRKGQYVLDITCTDGNRSVSKIIIIR